MVRILYLGHDPDFLDQIRKYMEGSGYEVIHNSFIDECMETCGSEEQRPDLIVVSDLIIGMNSWDVCHTIKDRDSSRNIPIVPVLDYDNCLREVYKNCVHECDGYITRPLRREKFIGKINSILSRGRLERRYEIILH